MAAGTLVSSGSSGNMPTGSGSERLRRALITGLNVDWQEILSGTAGHIYTVLSLICTNTTSSDAVCAATVEAGGQELYLFGDRDISGSKTFVFNDRFVLEEDDDLNVYTTSTNGDFYVSYIDADWT